MRQFKCLTALKTSSVSQYETDSTAELRSVNFFYFPCLGTMKLPSPFVFYAVVDIVIRFFNTDLSLLIRLSVIEVNQKNVVTKTSVRYSIF